MEPRHYRSDRHLQQIGGLFVGKLLDIGQKHDLRKFWRHTLDRPKDILISQALGYRRLERDGLGDLFLGVLDEL